MLLAIQGHDPAYSVPRAQFQAWFHLWKRHPEIHKAVHRAWPIIKDKMLRGSSKGRWSRRRGIIGSLILLLSELGWDPTSPTSWTDSAGEHWAMGGDCEADLTDVINHIMNDVERKVWEKAAKHRNGKGPEQ